MTSSASPWEAREHALQQVRSFHGRSTDAIGIELPLRDGYDDIDFEQTSGDGSVPLDAVDPALLAEIDAVASNLRYRLFPADAGRGASGQAIAWEVIGHVSDVGGVLALAWGTANGVRLVYRAIAKKLGRRPCVSLGTATFLAAADLCDRLGHDTFELASRGEVVDPPPDFSYTGDNYFFCFFRADARLHSYIVHEFGRVSYLGPIDYVASWNGMVSDRGDATQNPLSSIDDLDD